VMPPTDAELDHWRTVSDEPADQAVAAYFAEVDEAEPVQLLSALVRHIRLPPEDQVPAIAAFLVDAARLPDWAEEPRIRRGQAFFGEWALHQFTALYLASLPSAYAAAKGVHVLWLTAPLQDDAERRLNERAQFLMDVTTPDGFRPGGQASGRVLHVRLMHAAVRWLIDHDPRVMRVADADPGPLPPGPMWADSWGRPLNQEDLAGTLLTFTTVVFDAFRRSGVETSAESREDYFYLWRVIGSLLGIHEELIPADVSEAEALQTVIFRRQHAPSAVGADLTATLLGLAGSRLPRPVAGLAPAMVRRYVGDAVADMIAVPPAGTAKAVLGVLVAFTRLLARARRADPFPRWLSARLGRWLLDGLLAADRKGARVPFAIPDHLADLR
jgi:ER-bound oxygenase mpaB/B'/Rubber oxygenase, catalytic domain